MCVLLPNPSTQGCPAVLRNTSKNATRGCLSRTNRHNSHAQPTPDTAATPAPPRLLGSLVWIKMAGEKKSCVFQVMLRGPSWLLGFPASRLETGLFRAAVGEIATKPEGDINCGDFGDLVKFPCSCPCCAAPRAQPHRRLHRSATKPPLEQPLQAAEQPRRCRAHGRADHLSQGLWVVLLLQQGGRHGWPTQRS